jgi:CBS domain-containing protein
MDGDTIAGIFTERDLLNRIVAARRDADVTPVDEVMTERVAFCEPDTTLESCRTTMTRNKLRHLPVVHDGRLVGIISSGDILARELHDQEETIRYLHEYMHGHV